MILTDVFREVRERVPAQDAARRYGMEFDRRGWCKCPFHDDRHASMSFKNGRFRCWACNASGDSVDFTRRLLGLEPIAAVERLNADFVLALPLHRKPTPTERDEAQRRRQVAEAHKQFEEWRKAFVYELCEVCCMAHIALQGIDTPADLDKLSAAEVLAIQWREMFEYWADTLADGTPEEQIEIFRERQVIQSRIHKILNSTQMKSSAA